MRHNKKIMVFLIASLSLLGINAGAILMEYLAEVSTAIEVEGNIKFDNQTASNLQITETLNMDPGDEVIRYHNVEVLNMNRDTYYFRMNITKSDPHVYLNITSDATDYFNVSNETVYYFSIDAGSNPANLTYTYSTHPMIAADTYSVTTDIAEITETEFEAI